MPNPCPPTYSTAHLARRLGVSVPTVQRWVDLGYVKAWKTVGGHRRIDAESAEDFIRVQTRQRGRLAMAPPFEAALPLSVLLVDEDAADRDWLCALVGVAVPGARVVCAANGFDALIEIGKATPDLVVIDVALPHLDGVEMVRHLCARGAARAPAIVAVAAPSGASGALPPGVTLLAKPVQPARFIESVNQALHAG